MKLTCAIVIGGEIVRPPAIVEVSRAEAADLARRGKGVPATEHDALNPDPQPSVVDGLSNASETVAPAVTLTAGEVDALVLAAQEAAAAAAAALAEADKVDGKNSAQRKADRKAADDAVAAAATAAAAAEAATAAVN